MNRVDAHLFSVSTPAWMQIAAVLLLQARIGVKAANVMSLIVFEVIQEQDTLVRLRIRISIA